MISRDFRLNRSPKAFAILELVIVLLVIAILTGTYMGTRGGGGVAGEAARGRDTLDRGQRAACQVNRSTLRTTAEVFRMTRNGEAPTPEAMARAGINVPKCPSGGTYAQGADGGWTCGKHVD